MLYSKYNFWLAWAFLFSIIACSPQVRLANLIKRHPELAKTDTIFKTDTITILPSKADTVIFYKQTDTVIVKENGVIVKYFYNTKDSTVYLKGERDTIRIIREVPVIVNTFESKPISWYERLWLQTKDFLIVILLGAIIVLFLLQNKKI